MDISITESLASLPEEDLQQYYVQLQQQSSKNKKEIAEKKAFIEHAKKELSRLTAGQQTRMEKMEALQFDKQLRLTQLKEQIQASNQKVKEIHQKEDEHLHELTNEYEQKLAACKTIEETIQKIHEDGNKKMPEDNLSIIETNLICKQHYEELFNMMNNLQKELEIVMGSKDTQNTNLQQLKEDVRVLREQTEFNQISLEEATTLKESLEAELAMLNIDYQSMCCNPNVDKPNSIFNEVNDKRVVLQDNVVKIKDKYLEIKSKCKAMGKEIQLTKLENAHLQSGIQNNQNAKALDIYSIQLAYKSALNTLQDASRTLDGIIKDRNLISNKVLSTTEVDLILDHERDDKIEKLAKQLALENNINSDFEFKLQEAMKLIQQIKGKLNVIKENKEELTNMIKMAQEAKEPKNNETTCICNLQQS